MTRWSRWSRPGVRRLRTPPLLAVVLLVGGGPTPVAGQSLVASAGLGIPIEPFDARTRALGGVGVGLPGWHLVPADPAAAGGLVLPAVTASYQPSRATLSDGRSAGHARFPNIGVSHPYRGSVFWAQLSSFLDQGWEIRTTRVLSVAGTPVSARDQFVSTGSIGEAQIGWARRVFESVSIGASLGSYTGKMERTFIRVIDSAALGSDVEPFVTQGRWRASGMTAGVGVAWDPTQLLRVSGSARWSGGLELTPSAGAVDDERTYAIPLQLRAGATFSLTSGFALTVGGAYADWSETGEDLADGATRGGTWSYGGGVEWSSGQLLGRPLPLRVGVRQVDLPFHFEGEAVSERLLSGGFGLYLLETETIPLARMEVALERGTRSGGGISEDFLRTTISVRVAGN